jgi:transglutaminase-like putative cysteine protease
MRWDILHRTRYDYAEPARDSFNEVRLKPITNEHQRLESYQLEVLPVARLGYSTDFYANCVQHFEISEPHTSLLIESHAVVATLPLATLTHDACPAPLATLPDATRSERCFDFLQASRYVDLDPATWRLALDAMSEHADTWQAAQAIMRFVHGHLQYEPNSTHVHTHMREVLAQRRGVCQDFAHVMIGMCRAIRIPALYVSGYLATETASATHAWTEVFIPGFGWRSLDPTHNRQADDTYVKIAVGRDYADVAPVSGRYRGTRGRTLIVDVRIRRLAET